MTDTISGTYGYLLPLNPGSGNPVTIVSSSTLLDGLAMAYSGLTLINAGYIGIPGTTGSGGAYSMPAAVIMVDSGTLTNQGSGTISGLGGTTQTGKTWGIGSYSDATVTVVNAGTIEGGAYGIHLGGAGGVTNQSGGTIIGYRGIASSNDPATVVNAGIIATYNYGFNYNTGVSLAAGGSVTNENGGTITGNYAIVGRAAALTVVNAGQIAGDMRGVALHAGGTISNQSGGTISGELAVLGYTVAITVVNAGSIAGSVRGIALGAGGSVSNQSGGVIDAVYGVGIGGYSGLLTVVNAGSVTGQSTGILFDAGGIVTNQSGGTISGLNAISADYDPLTVINAGSVAGGISASDLVRFGDAGVFFNAGGSLTNQASGAISGHWGVSIYNDAVPLVNYGDIAGNDATNSNGAGVFLAAGGNVTNQSGGTISGYRGVAIPDDADTVINAGDIAGSTTNTTISYSVTTYHQYGDPTFTRTTYAVITASGAGAFLGAGGSVTNQSGATISGYRGVAGYNDAMTVLNDGTIAGSTATAIIVNRTIVTRFSAGINGTTSPGTFISSVYRTTDSYGAGVFLGAGGSVTNGSSGAISGYHGIAGYANATTIVNDGSIAGSTNTISNGAGILLGTGASVINQTAGMISGFHGISLTAVGTVMNYGGIAGSNSGYYQRDRRGSGVGLTGGGITNQSGGTISGYWAVAAYTDAATVVNSGSIVASTTVSYDVVAAGGRGVYLQTGGSVTNQVSGVIGGWDGIRQGNTGTLAGVNYGNISGNFNGPVSPFPIRGAGVYFIAGSFTNQSGGTISGYAAIDAFGVHNNVLMNNVTVVNAGLLAGSDLGGGIGTDGTPQDSFRTGSGVYFGRGGYISNARAGTITGHIAVKDAHLNLTLVNDGIIRGLFNNGSGLIQNGAGVQLVGGSITNLTNGVISGYLGIYNSNTGPITVVNAGTISGAYVAIYLGGGERGAYQPFARSALATSFITNQSGGLISGTIFGSDAATTIVNAGSIEGGIALNVGGAVTNQSGGTIRGGVFGKYQPVTVVNAGTIATTQDAVYFGPGTHSRLIVDPGAVFTGTIAGGGGVVELAATSTQETLSGFGTSITNFATLQLDSDAAWTVAGNDSASGLGTIAITGFSAGDTIDLTGFVAVSDSFASNQLVLTDTISAHATLAIQGSFASNAFQIFSDGKGGTDITLCFLAGTLIRTPDGEVPVERLTAGDEVVTHRGEARAIVWLGAGRVLATPARRSAATPVIIRKGALADGVPHQDLRVTKGHSFYFDDVLIPAEFLVNHRSIIWDDHAREVELYHIELARHDVLLANGAPAESYRDDGNRWLFQNANDGWDQPAKPPCAPVLTGGPIVDAIWRRLLDRTGPLNPPPMTDDPDLHLLIDGVRVDAREQWESTYFFRLPSCPGRVVVASRAAVPSEFAIARDPRSLGIGLRQVVMRQGAKFMLIDADDERLTSGFHAYEADCNLRWTDGHAELPIEAFARFDEGADVTLHLGGATRYPDERQRIPIAAGSMRGR